MEPESSKEHPRPTFARRSEPNQATIPPEPSLETVRETLQPEPTYTQPDEQLKEELRVDRPRQTSQHRYLQNLVKHMAEERGYRAIIEQPTPDGQGKVDVGLERDGKKIACEISVTTTSEHELSNIQKCLRAGYDTVILCSQEKRTLEKVKSLASQKLAETEVTGYGSSTSQWLSRRRKLSERLLRRSFFRPYAV